MHHRIHAHSPSPIELKHFWWGFFCLFCVSLPCWLFRLFFLDLQLVSHRCTEKIFIQNKRAPVLIRKSNNIPFSSFFLSLPILYQSSTRLGLIKRNPSSIWTNIWLPFTAPNTSSLSQRLVWNILTSLLLRFLAVGLILSCTGHLVWSHTNISVSSL